MIVMRVVLAYSGGLDTSVILSLLIEKLKAEVITVTVDVGQSDDFDKIAWRAEKIGAVKHYTIDAKEEFVRDYVFKAIKANALYEGKYPLSSALARPLIAKKLVDVAVKERADAVAHGCSGKGNDQLRFDITIKALKPDIKIIAPVREWGLNRDWEIEYAIKKGLPINVKKKIYSIDENLWGRSIESGVLEDPWSEPPEEVFKWTTSPEKAPDKPEYLVIKFKEGVPVAINDENLGPVELITYLNSKAGMHGVGRIDHIEDRVIGLKSREVYECPAAAVLIEAHKDLEKLVLTKRELMFKSLVDEVWADLVYSGLWVEPLRRDLDILIDFMERRVTGNVKVKLFKGNVLVVGRESENTLYEEELISYLSKSTFDQKLAVGFANLWGLQSIIASQRMRD